jgi:RNA polymerase-binding transcription factor DksA
MPAAQKPVTKLTLAKHRSNLDALRAETEVRLASLQRGYDELAVAGEDVGAGDDEGGSEGDVSAVERDRLRSQIGEEQNVLEAIEAALVRAATRTWQQCQQCGEPIGAERLGALPTTDCCVSCKARQSW